MGKIAINGRFVVRRFGGQERYSYQVVKGLDKLSKQGEFELIVPEYANSEKIPELKNIEVKKVGNIKGHLWEQTSYCFYLMKNRKTGFNPCITCPIAKPDITTLHDIGQLINAQSYKNLYGKLSRQWHKWMFYSSAKHSKLIFTVSNYSKGEIIKHLGVDADRIVVSGSGWQHFENVKEDMTFFDRHPELQQGKYFLSASSLTPQKNFKWVKRAALNNPKEVFAIAGEKVSLTQEDNELEPENLIYLGYVTDGEMKALMRCCKAFIHPAKYEGFGLTPMEAMSVGAPIILSNATCLPEVYGNTVHYINPDDANVDLNSLLKQPVGESKVVLDKYSWEKTSEIVYNAIKRIYNI